MILLSPNLHNSQFLTCFIDIFWFYTSSPSFYMRTSGFPTRIPSLQVSEPWLDRKLSFFSLVCMLASCPLHLLHSSPENMQTQDFSDLVSEKQLCGLLVEPEGRSYRSLYSHHLPHMLLSCSRQLICISTSGHQYASSWCLCSFYPSTSVTP